MFESLHKRFQYYVFKNIATQVHSGDDYRKIKPVYMIILFNDEDRKHHELVRIRSDCDEKYHDSDGSLYHIYYVFLKEIDHIIKEKGKESKNRKEKQKYFADSVPYGTDCRSGFVFCHDPHGRHEFKRRSLSI